MSLREGGASKQRRRFYFDSGAIHFLDSHSLNFFFHSLVELTSPGS